MREAVDPAEETGTWHFGLIARWWDEFNVAEPAELAYYHDAIARYGQPALDVGCGTGRLLRPLLAAGLAVDGVDVSADMLSLCASRARTEGLAPRLERQAMHELDLGRTYGTIYICDSFGIGGRRDHDREALRRIRDHLAPGGALVFSVGLPYDGLDLSSWGRWLPGRRDGLPTAWPEHGERRTAADGDEIELTGRLAELDPLAQRHRLEMRARLWRGDRIAGEEIHSLDENLYFAQEILLLLQVAGFGDVSVEGRYTGRPATADDTTLVFIARA